VNFQAKTFLFVKGPAADATDAPQPWGFPVMKMISIFFVFPSNGARVEWNWQGKTEVLGENPVPVPLCPPQILQGLTRDRTRASALRGRRLTAWAMARPRRRLSIVNSVSSLVDLLADWLVNEETSLTHELRFHYLLVLTLLKYRRLLWAGHVGLIEVGRQRMHTEF
jgi:hypothetical protein